MSDIHNSRAAAVLNAMLVWRGDRLLMALSVLGLGRCYIFPRLGGVYSQRAAQHRLYRRSRSTGDRSTNDVVSPPETSVGGAGAGAVDQDSHVDEWDTWEFGTWKVWTDCFCSLTPSLQSETIH